MTTPSPPDEVAEAMRAVEAEREAREKEYGQYEAIDAIEILGARAFNAGDRVPASHVERGVVKAGQVRKLSPSRSASPPRPRKRSAKPEQVRKPATSPKKG